MDGTLMNALHGNLNLLSEESMNKLLGYFETGILTLQDRNSLLNELTGHGDTSKALKALD